MLTTIRELRKHPYTPTKMLTISTILKPFETCKIIENTNTILLLKELDHIGLYFKKLLNFYFHFSEVR